MKFSAYDILSALIPGFVILLVLAHFQYLEFDKDLIIPYTGIAFIIGYFVNTFSSWIEGFLYWTWGGKPSTEILNGKQIWKVKFYNHEEAKKRLAVESENKNPNNDELFLIAMRYSSGNEKVEALNTSYIFSRVILTTIIICSAFVIWVHYQNVQIGFTCTFLILVAWLRSKQRAYYYVREVLNSYLKKEEKLE